MGLEVSDVEEEQVGGADALSFLSELIGVTNSEPFKYAVYEYLRNTNVQGMAGEDLSTIRNVFANHFSIFFISNWSHDSIKHIYIY